MRKKKIFTLLAITWMAMLSMIGAGAEEAVDMNRQWQYTLEDGFATITGYVEEPSGILLIPSELYGCAVTGIGDAAFIGCDDLTGVIIPYGVTSIGRHAFNDCDGLASVAIPNGVTSIGDSAFIFCGSLAHVTIPDSVVSIGSSAFAWCSVLTRVIVPDSVTSFGFGVFDPPNAVMTGDNYDDLNDDEVIYGSNSLILYVTEGSLAEQYAQENEIPYTVEDPEEAIPLIEYLDAPGLYAFAERFEEDFPAAVLVCHDGEAGGTPVRDTNPETIRAVFRALCDIRVLGEWPVSGHTDDYLNYYFEMQDGSFLYGFEFQDGMLLDAWMGLHEITGFGALQDALPDPGMWTPAL